MLRNIVRKSYERKRKVIQIFFHGKLSLPFSQSSVSRSLKQWFSTEETWNAFGIVVLSSTSFKFVKIEGIIGKLWLYAFGVWPPLFGNSLTYLIDKPVCILCIVYTLHTRIELSNLYKLGKYHSLLFFACKIGY